MTAYQSGTACRPSAVGPPGDRGVVVVQRRFDCIDEEDVRLEGTRAHHAQELLPVLCPQASIPNSTQKTCRENEKLDVVFSDRLRPGQAMISANKRAAASQI